MPWFKQYIWLLNGNQDLKGAKGAMDLARRANRAAAQRKGAGSGRYSSQLLLLLVLLLA